MFYEALVGDLGPICLDGSNTVHGQARALHGSWWLWLIVIALPHRFALRRSQPNTISVNVI
jgi:hypothetical protein